MNEQFSQRAGQVDLFLARHFDERSWQTRVGRELADHSRREAPELMHGLKTLLESARYSTESGGKRFRPVLAILVAEALGFSAERVLPYGAAVECIHTYSLIHDDLPSLDNDDYRRGLPTNHRVFGEAMALLAGDALLTEAFQLIASSYVHEPAAGLKATAILAAAAGLGGMVGGQAIDLDAKLHRPDREGLEIVHRLKTGALIRAAVEGAGVLCFANDREQKELRQYGANLGLAFQVADDLLDFSPEHPEAASYTTLMGVEPTKAHLSDLTERCLTALESWPKRAEPLRALAQFNRSRTH